MGKCSSCTKEVPAGAKFCPACGNTVETEKPKKNNDWRNLGIVGAVIAAVAVIAAISPGPFERGVAGFTGGYNSPVDTPDTAVSDSANICADVAEIARILMTARQENVPMQQMYEIDSSELARNMVISAYDSPAFNTERYKERAIANFQNEAYLSCIRSLK